MIEQFYCKEGYIAFLIPFSYTSENSSNRCTDIFSKIDPHDDREQYEAHKEDLRDLLKYDFPDAANCYKGATEQDSNQEKTSKCHYCERHKQNAIFKSRNLCPCFSISRKFHDDQSQNIPRLDIYLGTYHIHYDALDDHFFEFYMDSLLLLSNEAGGECGYLVFNISLTSIRENCIGIQTQNSLDNIIFLKHLFYKNRLKCVINNERDISVQEWTDKYVKKLLRALGITDYTKAVNSNVLKNEENNIDGAAFRYSIIELNNVVDASSKILAISDTNTQLRKYRNQLYGLMVSDEGWRYISSKQLKQQFDNNHWSTRNFITSFFLGRNALIINQYELAEKTDSKDHKSYNEFSHAWFRNYKHIHENDFYSVYAKLHPCVPGISSLVFYAFQNAIYKDFVLEKVKIISDAKNITDEEKYQQLASILQRHSMSLDEFKNVEDCIYSQFGIPAELKNLQERYQREANNVQNKKVVNLTHVTLWTSISALIIAALAIGINGGSIFSMGMNGTIFILAVALLIPLLVYLITQYDLIEKHKKRKLN